MQCTLNKPTPAVFQYWRSTYINWFQLARPLSSIIPPLRISHRLLPGLTCITPSIPRSLIRRGHPPDALPLFSCPPKLDRGSGVAGEGSGALRRRIKWATPNKLDLNQAVQDVRRMLLSALSARTGPAKVESSGIWKA